jgi:formimidoylglutamate deiminase
MAGVFMEMLCSGYTTCAEFHYLHHAPDGARYDNPAELSERVFAAAAASGIALTHLPVWYQRSGFGADSVLDEQRRFVNDPEAYLEIISRCRAMAAQVPGAGIGVAPHSLRAVPTDRFVELVAHAGPGEPIHLHVAEQPREVSECVGALGARPVEWLLEHAGMGPHWCLVHATHIDESECRRAAATGAVAGLCPTTEADLGDGVFPAQQWFDAGGRFGIGSDSNLRICPAEELRSLEFSQRLVSGRRNVLAAPGQSTGGNLVTRAALGGAQACAQPVGVIEPGRRADLLELEPDHPLLAGLAPALALDTWLFAGSRDMLRTVRVGGRLLVENGRHVKNDALAGGYRQVLEKLRS